MGPEARAARFAAAVGAAVCLCVLLGSVRGASAADLYHSIRAGLGYHYSVGDYGGDSSTGILYIPLTTRAELGRWTFWTTVPYLRINGPGGFVQGPDGPIATTGGVQDGLGDILTRGSYFLPSQAPLLPAFELVGIVKYPTASRSKGLGTGEFDYGFELEMSWTIDRWTPYAMIGYRILGSSPDIPLDNVIESTLGIQYRLLQGINVGLLLDYREAASEASGQRLEWVPFASFRVGTHWAIDTYASAGMADGSPDAGFGFQVSYILSNLE